MKNCRPEIDEEVDYSSLLKLLIQYSVDIDINNSPDLTFYSTFQIIFSVPSILYPTSTGKLYYTDNNFFAEVLYFSVTKSLWILPPSIIGVQYVKRKIFLLSSTITTSTSDYLYFRFHFPLRFTSTDFIVTPSCLWWVEFMDIHIYPLSYIFSSARIYFTTFSPPPFYSSCTSW